MFKKLFSSKRKGVMTEKDIEQMCETPEVPVEPVRKKIPFDIYAGPLIVKRQYDAPTLCLILDNVETVWNMIRTNKPMLEAQLVFVLEDEFLKRTLEPALIRTFGDEKYRANPQECYMSFVKLEIVILSVYTTIDVAYDLLRFDRHGCLEGASDITVNIIELTRIPIQYDIQVALVTCVVWSISLACTPSRPMHTAIEVLGLFEMQYDEDLKDVMGRLVKVTEKVKVPFN